MKIEDIIEIFDERAKKEIVRLRKQNSELLRNIRNIEKENFDMRLKLNSFQNRKLVKILTKYYLAIEKYPVLRLIAKIIYAIVYLPAKVVNLFISRYNSSERHEITEKISEIIQDSPSRNVVFFIAPVLWDIPLYQRPQHIASYMAKEGVLYFYVIKWQEEMKVRELSKNCYEVSAIDLEFDFIKDIVEKTKGEKQVFVKTYSTELENISEELQDAKDAGAKLIYEYVDEIDPSIAGRSIPKHVIERFERIVKDEENSYIVATASKLFDDISFYRKKNFALITNGVDYDHFSKKFKKSDLPFQLLRIVEENKPIVGYYGALASWMDYELIKYVAQKRPDYNFLLIGVDYDGSVIASDIESISNVFVLPPVDYKELPRYAYFLDVCMIPFKINEITKSTSPIKLFEYMALHKPIVTTAMPECKKYKSVLIGNSKDEFVEQLDRSLELREDSEYIKILEKEALENTWKSKAKQMIKLIES